MGNGNISSSSSSSNDNENYSSDNHPLHSGPMLNLPPGQVEEAVHYMSDSGFIDLSFLRFSSSSSSLISGQQYPQHTVINDHNHNDEKSNIQNIQAQQQNGSGIESFLDIAVFEVPQHCTSRNCDLSKYGVGSLSHFQDATYLSLCQAGRLILDHNKFKGKHTQLMIPRIDSGTPMPDYITSKAGKFSFPQKRYYEVMIANCNEKNEQTIHVTGQVVFDFVEYGSTPLTIRSLSILMSMAFCVFVILSMLAIRINCGTRSDFYSHHRRQSFFPIADSEIDNDDNDGDDSDNDDNAISAVDGTNDNDEDQEDDDNRFVDETNAISSILEQATIV